MERLLPDPGPTTLSEQLAAFDPAAAASGGRPHVFTNFAVTVDGHATIEGRSGAIGSDVDTALLMGLRECADAVLVGAGTIRGERYGRLLPAPAAHARREADGRPADPVAVTVTRSMDLPWEAGLFASGAGEVIVFTPSEAEPPPTATPVSMIRRKGAVELGELIRWLGAERGVRALLCEGGPALHGELLAAGLVDELFVTLGPLIGGGEGPRLAEGLRGPGTGLPIPLELLSLVREGDELFARYAVRGEGRAALR